MARHQVSTCGTVNRFLGRSKVGWGGVGGVGWGGMVYIERMEGEVGHRPLSTFRTPQHLLQREQVRTGENR